MEYLFRDEFTKCIRVYMATEAENDPIYHTIDTTLLNPLPIKAIVTDLIASQIIWKMPGITTDSAKEIITEKKNRPLIEKSHKIEIDGEDYLGWKVNGRMQIREEGNFIRVAVYKQTSMEQS